MPLVWAHAEYIKLLRSLADGAVFDLPPQTVKRYQRERQPPRWSPGGPTGARRHAGGAVLRIELPAPATVTWRVEGAEAGGGNAGGGKVGGGLAGADVATRDTGLGVHVVELPTAGLAGALAFAWRGAAGDAGKARLLWWRRRDRAACGPGEYKVRPDCLVVGRQKSGGAPNISGAPPKSIAPSGG